jgi:hypothetical protein
MRPVDQEPFLEPRDEPKDTKDGADLAREQAGRFSGDRPAHDRRR